MLNYFDERDILIIMLILMVVSSWLPKDIRNIAIGIALFLGFISIFWSLRSKRKLDQKIHLYENFLLLRQYKCFSYDNQMLYQAMEKIKLINLYHKKFFKLLKGKETMMALDPERKSVEIFLLESIVNQHNEETLNHFLNQLIKEKLINRLPKDHLSVLISQLDFKSINLLQ